MSSVLMIAVDILAITVLVFGIYFPRHHRGDLVVAFLGVNVGVLAVTQVLAHSTVEAGLGLGLFGVLSIIRLRSSEISQREVAYYFTSLAIGLITGLSSSFTPLVAALIVILLGTLALADSGLISRNSATTQQIQLDHAVTNPAEIKAEVARLIGAEVAEIKVLKIDLINDSTLLDARIYPLSEPATAIPAEMPQHTALLSK